MATSIIKRSGKKEQYQGYKIEEAIRKAFHSSGTSYNRSIYEEVEAKLSHQDSAHVEEIQDMIERALFRSGYFDTAKAFITYRFLHKMQREQLGGLYSGNTYVDCKQTVEEYIGQSDWRIAANSNTTYSNAGLINNTAGKVYGQSADLGGHFLSGAEFFRFALGAGGLKIGDETAVGGRCFVGQTLGNEVVAAIASLNGHQVGFCAEPFNFCCENYFHRCHG